MTAPGKNEKIKLYVVAGLAVIFLGLGYYRFLHSPKPAAAPEAAAPEAPASTRADQWEIPAIALANAGSEAGSADGLHPVRLTLRRDIFNPLNPPPAVPPELQRNTVSAPPKPSFVLKGTILGGARPVAIIDDQFLRPGDPIGVYRLVRIEKNRVWLAFGRQQLELEAMVNDE